MRHAIRSTSRELRDQVLHRPTIQEHQSKEHFRYFRGGFTILELLVVLGLMALMASVVMVSMNGRLQGAHREQVLEALRAMDQRGRHGARTQVGEVALQLDAHEGVIQVIVKNEGKASVVDAYGLPGGFEIERVWVLHEGRVVERETLTIPFDRHGIGPTYGVTIRSTGDDDEPFTLALLVAGVSGQFTGFDHDDEVQNILSQIARHDAD